MFFVAVSFSDEKIANLFELARLVVQPDFVRAPHITLRGPYRSKSNISDSIIGKDVGPIRVRKPGRFFNSRQSTVFLDIEIAGVSDFWHKPDFPDGVPHLTIYDGADRNFAWVVFRAMSMHRWGFLLNSTPMQVLSSKQQIETDFLLNFENHRNTFRLLGRETPSVEQIKAMPQLDRIILFNEVCSKINSLGHLSRRLDMRK